MIRYVHNTILQLCIRQMQRQFSVNIPVLQSLQIDTSPKLHTHTTTTGTHIIHSQTNAKSLTNPYHSQNPPPTTYTYDSTSSPFVSNGVYYYGLRYYSAELGRWINRDPIGANGGINVYTFVGNAPLDNFDSFGFSKDLSGYVIDTTPCEWKGLSYANGFTGRTIGLTVFEEDPFLGPKLGDSVDCEKCGKPGKKYKMADYKCSLGIEIKSGIDPDKIVNKQSTWKHESDHVGFRLNYVKSSIALINKEGGRCLPNECDADRKKYIKMMIKAYQIKSYYEDANLHSWDYPEDLIERWKKIAKGFNEDYEAKVADANRYKTSYYRCLSRIMSHQAERGIF